MRLHPAVKAAQMISGVGLEKCKQRVIGGGEQRNGNEKEVHGGRKLRATVRGWGLAQSGQKAENTKQGYTLPCVLNMVFWTNS